MIGKVGAATAIMAQPVHVILAACLVRIRHHITHWTAEAGSTVTGELANAVRAGTAIEAWVVPAVVVLHAAGWVITAGETGLRRENA